MRTFRIALAQVNPTVGDLEGNRDKVLRYIQEARSLAADLVAFPELCVTGYPPEDLLFKPAFLHDNARITQEIVARSQGISLVLGFANTSNGD
ncbi:MAG: NAD+ synthase, partial [Chloroflexi bacterium]|nr:NAD+ synthase [Chloroflexota bacterium]